MNNAEIYDSFFEKNGDCKRHSRTDCPFCRAAYAKKGGAMGKDGKPERGSDAPPVVDSDDPANAAIDEHAS